MSKEYYDNFFKKYGPEVHLDPVRFSEIAKLCKGSVLDIGCGTGNLSDFYNGEYTGIDISDTAINFAKKLRRNSAKFLTGDFSNPQLEIYTKFDTFVLAEFLEHIRDDTIVFAKVKALANPNARLIISVPNGDRVPDESHLKTFTVPQLRAKFSQLGVVKFHNWPGFEQRILLTVDLGQKNKEQLTLAIIAKNEAKGLENCILSCLDFVDKVYISIDTASSDSTLDIAKRYADGLFSHQWQNDFSAARNNLGSKLDTDWVLWLDGHEYIREHKDLTEILSKNVDGIYFKIYMEDGSFFWFARLVRKYVRWAQPVHNYPLIKTSEKFDGLVAVHDRDNFQAKKAVEDRSKQRNEMVYTILKEKVKQNKKDSRSLFYLGQQSLFIGDFKQAIKWYKRYLRVSIFPGERFAAFYGMGVAHAHLGHKLRSLYSYFKADDEMPGRWEIKKRIGATWMWFGAWQKALPYLVDALGKQTGDFSHNPEARDDAETWDYIGQCLFNLNKRFEAKVAWSRAVELETQKEKKKILKDRLKVLKYLLKHFE